MIFVITLFLFSFVSAELLTIDNIVKYEEPNLLKVDFVNTFGLGETLGSVELKSHEVENGEIQVRKLFFDGAKYYPVMYYDFYGWELYENGLGNVYFKDMKTGEDTEKLYYFAEWKELTGEFPVYSDDGLKIIGYKNSTYYDWVKYDSKDIPNTKLETVRIALMVYETGEDYADAVWSVAGKKIKEHAVWVITDAVSSWNLTDTGINWIGLDWKNDGTVLYGVHSSGARVEAWNCSTAWEVDTCLGAWANLSTSAEDTGPRGLFIKPDGTKVYTIGTTNNRMYQYNCTTAWNLDSCSYHGFIGTIDGENNPEDITWNVDGTKVYEVDRDTIEELNCADAWSLTSCNDGNSALSLVGKGTVEDAQFKSDGSKFYFVELTNYKVHQYTCSTPFDVSSCTDDSISLYIGENTAVFSLFFNDGGNYMYVGGNFGVFGFTMSPLSSDKYPSVVLNSPTNYYNSTTTTINFNTTVTDDFIVQNVSFYLDGVLDTTNTSQVNGTYIFTKSLSTGLHNWSILAYDNASQANQSETKWVNITIISPTLNLYSPENNLVTTTKAQTFIGDVTDDGEIINVSLYLDGVLNETNSTGVKDVNYSFSKILGEGSHTWYFKAYDNGSNPSDSATWNIEIDTINPVLNVTIPENKTYLTNYVTTNITQVTFNWSVYDANLDKCWYGFNNGTRVEVACNTNQSLSIYYDSYNINFYANDTLNQTSSLKRTPRYAYKVYEVNKTYSNETTEGSVENFELWVEEGDGYDIQSVVLYYNGNSDVSTLTNVGGMVKASSELLIPGVAVDTNKTFYFTIFLNDSTSFNSTFSNQTVYTLAIDDCSSQPYPFLYFNLKDEESRNPIRGDIEISLDVTNSLNFQEIINLSQKFTNKSYFEICSSTPLNVTDLLLNAEIRYSSDYGDNYSAEFYHIQRSELIDYPQNITLFDLLVDDTTRFKVLYRGEDLIGVEGAIIQLLRKYISDGIYEVVEAPLTSSESTAILHIDTATQKYNAIVVKNGEVLGIFENLAFVCQSELTGECTLNLFDSLVPPNLITLNTLRDFAYYINTTNETISLTFSVPSGDIESVNLVATQTSILGTSVICNQTIISSAGSFDCSYSTTIDDSEIVLTTYKSGDLVVSKSYLAKEDLSSDWDGNNYFIVVILLLSLVAMAFSSPEWMVINAVLTLLVAGGTWLIRGMDFTLGVGSLIWIIVAAVIIIIKLAKQEDR